MVCTSFAVAAKILKNSPPKSIRTQAQGRLIGCLVGSLILHGLLLWAYWPLNTGISGFSSFRPLRVEVVSRKSEAVKGSSREVVPDRRGGVTLDTLSEPAFQRGRPAHPSEPSVQSAPPEKNMSPLEAQAPIAKERAAAAPASPAALFQSEGGTRLPTQVELTYELRSGAAGRLLGQATARYLAAEDEYYSLTTQELVHGDDVRKTTGWFLEVSGRIRSYGLRPEIFQRRGMLAQRLFNLGESSVEGGGGENEAVNGRLQDGILDRQSLAFMFMHQPPQRQGEILLADGKSIVAYAYALERFETLESPVFGRVQTQKMLFKAIKSRDMIEMWLLPDQKYLPLLIRYTDAQGEVTEQRVLSLSIH